MDNELPERVSESNKVEDSPTLSPLSPPQDEFVAMEHPMEHTLDTAWRMIYERKMPVWILIHAFPDHDKVRRAERRAAAERGKRGERNGWMEGGVEE